MKFIKDRYYLFEDTIISHKYYFKCKDYNDNIIKIYFCITDNIYYEGDIIRFNILEGNYFEIKLDTIIDYLPDNHPDKLAFYRKRKINYLLSNEI